MKKSRFILLIMVFMLIFTGCAAAETAEPQPTPEPQRLPLSVNGYELTYADILQESISFHLPQDRFSIEENAVNFTMVVNETEYPLFTMYVGSDDGDTHTVLRGEAGEILPVSYIMAPIPQELSTEAAQLFQLDAAEAVTMLNATMQISQLPTGDQSYGIQPTVINLDSYQLTFTMLDYIRLQMTDEADQVTFELAMADGRQFPVFTLACNADQGDILVKQEDDTGALVPVAFTVMSLPEELTGDDVTTFYQAQELVNDVLSTMQLRKAAQ